VTELANVIHGQNRRAASGRWDERGRSPDGTEELRALPSTDERDVDQAVESAAATLPEWSALTWPRRGEMLRALAAALASQSEDLATQIAIEVGKPLGEAKGEIANAVRVLEYFAGLAFHSEGELVSSARDAVHLFVERRPLGVVAAITPWNFPVNIPIVKIAPALLAGNTVVWKPASAAAAVAYELTQCFLAAGLPPGALNLVLGSGELIGSALVDDPRVAAVTFTGSTEVGKQLSQRAARRSLRCLCEMGGKNAVVVARDADLDLAVDAIVEGAFRFAGQKCTATSRVIVEAPVRREVTERLARRLSELTVGPPLQVGTYLGPLISAGGVDSALDHIRAAEAAGARVVAGGNRPTAGQFASDAYLAPTLLDKVAPSMPIASTELFAPVVALLEARNLNDAVSIVNATRYGLSASVFTSSLTSAFTFARKADVGAVQVNLATAGAEFQAPFGGTKDSGTGFREQGTASLEFYSEKRTIAMRYA
jgi:acyl-CoA reductase-like NAD-dependent aldehyde dehydrogenase